MKIIQHTPTQLILKHRPIAHWLIGSFLTIVGVVTIILFSKASTFTCERIRANQGSCELKHSYFIMSKTIILSIEDLTGTEVVISHSRGIDSFFMLQPHYQLILLTPTEKIALSHYGTINREKQDIMADKINTFLNNPHESLLIIKRDNRWLSYLIGGFLIIVGLLAQLRKIITITFDKAVDSLKIERQGWLGNQVIEHPLEEIVEVKLNISSYFNSKTFLYQVVLALSSGENILLTSNNSLGRARKQKIVDGITNFIAEN